MRTALVVAITPTFAIGAQAQTRADRSPSGGSAEAAGKVRVETQAQYEARQHRCTTPLPASVFRRVMRRGSATDNGRGDDPDAGDRGAPWSGAGEGNRTLVCSLGSCRSTIELRPQKAFWSLRHCLGTESRYSAILTGPQRVNPVQVISRSLPSFAWRG
jgi:hypothetical protein